MSSLSHFVSPSSIRTMADVEQGKADAVPKVGNKATTDQSLCEIVIERENAKPTTKFAKRDWQNQQHSEITEACVQDLGFSTVEENGEKKKSIRLRWRPKKHARSLVDDFFIIPDGDHEIVLGLDAYDKWFQATNPGVYPCLMKKGASDFLICYTGEIGFALTRSKTHSLHAVPKEILKKREEDSKIRHEEEVAAQKRKWLEILQRERQPPQSSPPAPRLASDGNCAGPASTFGTKTNQCGTVATLATARG